MIIIVKYLSWTKIQRRKTYWSQEGELREVAIEVGSDGCSNLGRRATLTEKLLGLSTTVFEDGLRIMVASVIPNSPVNDQRSVKIGINYVII